MGKRERAGTKTWRLEVHAKGGGLDLDGGSGGGWGGVCVLSAGVDAGG